MKTSENDYELLRRLAAGEPDLVCDMAQEIVETLEKEVVGRETSWHDIELSTVAEEIIRRHLKPLLDAFEAAVERMEAVADRIPVENRSEGISQACHVRHMAGHLAQHAKIARAALALAKGEA